MSSKKLPVAGIANELEGASLYFSHPPQKEVETTAQKSPGGPTATPTGQPAPLKRTQGNVKLPMHARKHARKHAITQASEPGGMRASPHDNQQDRKHEGNHARRQASNRAAKKTTRGEEAPKTRNIYDYIETIRKSVKKVGREELFVRLTPEEKNELRSIVYKINEFYRGQGGKTSENEISRIALNWLLADYKTNGEFSILAITQEALNA